MWARRASKGGEGDKSGERGESEERARRERGESEERARRERGESEERASEE
jgi:hypothetical protein